MNRIYDKQEIARMLDKFMAGETSLNEEHMLAEYFRTNEVGDEWQESIAERWISNWTWKSHSLSESAREK